MKVKANRAYSRFRRALLANPKAQRPWRGTSYRVTTLRYAHAEDILSGEGSYQFGGRWNAPGSVRAVYGSLSDVAAVAESRSMADYAGIPYPFRTPRLLVAIEFDLARVVKLTDPISCAALEFLLDEASQEDWRRLDEDGLESLTQAFGRACFDSGLNGILAPSARVPDAVNVVYFPGNRTGPTEAVICESEQLDRINYSET